MARAAPSFKVLRLDGSDEELGSIDLRGGDFGVDGVETAFWRVTFDQPILR